MVAVPRSSHIFLAVPVLSGLNYLAVPLLAGEKLPGRACVGQPMQLPGRACVGRPVKLHGLCWPIGNCIFWVEGYLCLVSGRLGYRWGRRKKKHRTCVRHPVIGPPEGWCRTQCRQSLWRCSNPLYNKDNFHSTFTSHVRGTSLIRSNGSKDNV